MAPVSARLAMWIGSSDEDGDAASVAAILSTVVDVLLTLYLISEEPATPEQVAHVVLHVVDGRLDRLPLLPRGPCFCGSDLRYKKCHGQRPR